jgi:hypothetical protein
MTRRSISPRVAFMQGLLLDATTGEAAILDSRFRHIVYIELPALPNWPVTAAEATSAASSAAGPGDDVIPSKHPWLTHGLPVLNLARTTDFAVHNASIPLLPFQLDASDNLSPESVRFALTVLVQLLDTTESVVSPPMATVAPQSALFDVMTGRNDQRIDDARRLATLQSFWARPECAGIAHTKLARRRFLQLWVTRTEFMLGCKEHYLFVKRNGYVFLCALRAFCVTVVVLYLLRCAPQVLMSVFVCDLLVGMGKPQIVLFSASGRFRLFSSASVLRFSTSALHFATGTFVRTGLTQSAAACGRFEALLQITSRCFAWTTLCSRSTWSHRGRR